MVILGGNASALPYVNMWPKSSGQSKYNKCDKL